MNIRICRFYEPRILFHFKAYFLFIHIIFFNNSSYIWLIGHKLWLITHKWFLYESLRMYRINDHHIYIYIYLQCIKHYKRLEFVFPSLNKHRYVLPFLLSSRIDSLTGASMLRYIQGISRPNIHLSFIMHIIYYKNKYKYFSEKIKSKIFQILNKFLKSFLTYEIKHSLQCTFHFFYLYTKYYFLLFFKFDLRLIGKSSSVYIHGKSLKGLSFDNCKNTTFFKI